MPVPGPGSGVRSRSSPRAESPFASVKGEGSRSPAAWSSRSRPWRSRTSVCIAGALFSSKTTRARVAADSGPISTYIRIVPRSRRSPFRSTCSETWKVFTREPFLLSRSRRTQPSSSKAMRACCREMLSWARWSSDSAARPITTGRSATVKTRSRPSCWKRRRQTTRSLCSMAGSRSGVEGGEGERRERARDEGARPRWVIGRFSKGLKRGAGRPAGPAGRRVTDFRGRAPRRRVTDSRRRDPRRRSPAPRGSGSGPAARRRGSCPARRSRRACRARCSRSRPRGAGSRPRRS